MQAQLQGLLALMIKRGWAAGSPPTALLAELEAAAKAVGGSPTVHCAQLELMRVGLRWESRILIVIALLPSHWGQPCGWARISVL